MEFFHLKISEKKSVVVARATMVVVSLIAAFLARDPDSSVFRVVSFAWAGFGAAFGPVVLFALFWKRSNQVGRLGRHDCRRRHGVYLEVSDCPHGRRLGHL